MYKYDWKLTLKKGVKYTVLFILPALVSWLIVEYPQYMQLTVGGVLVMLVNFLKNKVGMRLP